MDKELIKLKGFQTEMSKDAGLDLERFLLHVKSMARKLKSKSKKSKK